MKVPKRGHSCATVGMRCDWESFSPEHNAIHVTMFAGNGWWQCRRCKYVTKASLQPTGWSPKEERA